TEYLNITGEHDFVLWGVENPGLYDEGLKLYGDIAAKRDGLLSYVAKMRRTAEAVKGRIYGPELLAFDTVRQSYRKGLLPLTTYADELKSAALKAGIAMRQYANLRHLDELGRLEAGIDFEKAAREQAEALALFSDEDREVLDEAVKDGANAPLKLQGHDEKTTRAFYGFLKEKLPTTGKTFGELEKYLHYRERTQALNAGTVLDELQGLERSVVETLTANDDERMLIRVAEGIERLAKLLELKVTPEEFAEYRKDRAYGDTRVLTGFLNKKIMDLDGYYDQALFLEEDFADQMARIERFYELTYQRDRHFVESMLAKLDAEGETRAVLVTGGYHTEHLRTLLKERGISYVCVCPQVLHETDTERYERLLLGQAAHTPAGAAEVMNAWMTRLVRSGGNLTPQVLEARMGIQNVPQPALAGSRIGSIENRSRILGSLIEGESVREVALRYLRSSVPADGIQPTDEQIEYAAQAVEEAYTACHKIFGNSNFWDMVENAVALSLALYGGQPVSPTDATPLMIKIAGVVSILANELEPGEEISDQVEVLRLLMGAWVHEGVKGVDPSLVEETEFRMQRDIGQDIVKLVRELPDDDQEAGAA
ncbi:MAG: hypothetical protein HQL11_06500, partial [Candidatus Omnitrophica bacterium]|nr:hypothetical protein [Candidatus Omnitrophota bacterium]